MKTLLFFLLSFLLSISTVFAQPSSDAKGDAAFLFAYYPKDGKQSHFFEGYKKHLEWHCDQEDPLVWYGWTVLSGDRLGMFVDGTFGISFEAFDNRVKPGEDGQHFAEYVSPYGDAAYRKVFKMESDLSTASRLEDWNPTATVEVYSISVVPGMEPLLEETIKKLTSALNKNASEFTIYRQLTGGHMPSYLMMVPHNGFDYFDSNSAVTTLSHLIKRSFAEEEANGLLENLSMCIKKIHGETWLYRKDLSYFPGKNN